MIEYNIDKSKEPDYKYVVWRGNSKGKGSCWRGIFHSNNKSECEKFIDKAMKKDLKNEKSLLQMINEISKRKRVLREQYKRRMQYVKDYKEKMEDNYE